MRQVMTRVLPEPGPARMSNGPEACCTASRCGGFNPANPTAVTSANQIDPNLAAPRTDSFVFGVDRELMAHTMLQVNYSYTRTTDLFGNYTANITPRVGVTLADYSAGPTLTGTLPDGSPACATIKPVSWRTV